MILFNLKNRLELLRSNWYDQITSHKKFDIIVSNPPYVEKHDPNIAKETLLYEPSLALFEENNIAYKYIAKDAGKVLKNDGNMYIEIGYHNKEAVISIFKDYGFKCENQIKDLNDHTRILKFSRIISKNN